MAALLQPGVFILTVFLGTARSQSPNAGNGKEDRFKGLKATFQENKLTAEGVIVLYKYKVIIIGLQKKIIADQRKLNAAYKEHIAKNRNLTENYKKPLEDQEAKIEQQVEYYNHVLEREDHLSAVISLRQAIEAFEYNVTFDFLNLNQTERWKQLVANTSSVSDPTIKERTIKEEIYKMNLTSEQFAEKVVSLYNKLSDIINEYMKNMEQGFYQPLIQPRIPKDLIAVAKIIFEHSPWRDSYETLLARLSKSVIQA